MTPNHVQQQFDVDEPNNVWVIDIPYIRTHEGWLYLAVVLRKITKNRGSLPTDESLYEIVLLGAE